MTDIRTIEAGKYTSSLAKALKDVEEFNKPEWIDFVKTSPHKTRPVTQEDFWQIRSASILRQIYIKKIVGVNRLRTRYGGRKRRGARPEELEQSYSKQILQASQKKLKKKKQEGNSQKKARNSWKDL
jgi:small subunit ribosomal protein S19e